jgi:hypothetical protein
VAVGQQTGQELEAERLDARFGVEHPADITADRASFHAHMVTGSRAKSALIELFKLGL